MTNNIFFMLSFCFYLHALIIFRIMLSKPSWILFLLTIKIFKDDEKLLANVTFPSKLLYGLRNPKICDVISAKRLLFVVKKVTLSPML